MILSFLSTRAGKFAAAGVAVILAVLAFLWWLDSREKAAVERDRAEAVSEATERQLRAERAANRKIEAVQASTAAESAKTDQAMKEAEDAEPEKARAAAGPVSRAAAERLRTRSRRPDAAPTRAN